MTSSRGSRMAIAVVINRGVSAGLSDRAIMEMCSFTYCVTVVVEAVDGVRAGWVARSTGDTTVHRPHNRSATQASQYTYVANGGKNPSTFSKPRIIAPQPPLAGSHWMEAWYPSAPA